MRRRVAADLESYVVNKDELNQQIADLEKKLWRSQIACDMAAVIGQILPIVISFKLNSHIYLVLVL